MRRELALYETLVRKSEENTKENKKEDSPEIAESEHIPRTGETDPFPLPRTPPESMEGI